MTVWGQPTTWTEIFGFVSGAWCVYLVTRKSIWNWPVGIANNLFFALLFWRVTLYADMALQGVYLVLAVWGWLFWLNGGPAGSPAPIRRMGRRDWVLTATGVVLGTVLMHAILVRINGSAPWADAFTTALSLAAQVALSRKMLENWWLWMAADLVYVPLYAARGLPLTAVLYAGFFILCVIGLRAWSRDFEARRGVLA